MKNLILLAFLLAATALPAQCLTEYAQPTAEAVTVAECGTWEVSGLERSTSAPTTYQYERRADSLFVRVTHEATTRTVIRKPYSAEAVSETIFLFNGWCQNLQ